MKRYVLKPPEGGTRPAFRIDYARELNEQQLAVVEAGDGPLLVVAGAGSGKTRTLTYRVARLVECGIPMESILLLTFTNKAAREMLRRVQLLLNADIRITGGTFHHVGNLFLRRHAERIGLKPNFTILDREDAGDVMSDVVTAQQAARNWKKFPKSNVLIDILSYAVNTESTPAKVLAEHHPAFFEMADPILRAINGYNARKRDLNLVDFDDMLLFWRELVRRHEDIRGEAHARWRYILVDEYQDTNRIQSDIVEMIAGPEGNLMVVGDDAQSIYSFRGAHFGNIIDFPKRFPSCRMFKLETNYRSTPQILDLANSAIRHNRRQFPKVLQARRAPGAKPERVICGTAGEQSQFTVQRMMELRDEGMDWRDMAVLYRAHWHSMELQMELTQKGIPFQVRSGLKFFEQAHVKDVAAYLRIVTNPRDEMAWKRVMKLYPRIGNAAADKIWTVLVAQGDPIGAVGNTVVVEAVPRSGREGWREFAKVLHETSDAVAQAAPGDMIRRILNGGYETYLEAQFPNALARVDDINRLADYAVRFRSAQELLTDLALSMTVVGKQAFEEPEDEDFVVLSTVHQAKGLEWRAVFMLWLVEGKFPDQRALKDDGGEEEERRLFYVSCTRAKDLLYLVNPTVGDERGMMGVIQRPSRFVMELDDGVFEEVTVGYDLSLDEDDAQADY